MGIFDSNIAAWGKEKQDALARLNVGVIGGGLLAQYVLSGLAGLGIGAVHIMTNQRNRTGDLNILCRKEQYGVRKVDCFAKVLRRINPNMAVIPVFSSYSREFPYASLDVIVDAGNDPSSKRKTIDMLGKKTLFISAYADRNEAKIGLYRREKMHKIAPSLDVLADNNFAGMQQDPVTSAVGAGLVCEEIRRAAFTYNDNDKGIPENTATTYCIWSPTRTKDGAYDNLGNIKGKKVLVIGAGGIGTFCASTAALAGAKQVHIVDNDFVEEKNLSRQFFYYDAIGLSKARVLATRLKELGCCCELTYTDKRIGIINLDKDAAWLHKTYAFETRTLGRKDYFSTFIKECFNSSQHHDVRRILDKGFDIVMGCVDNKYARLLLNARCQEYGVPYVDGGTGPFSGQLNVFVPGLSLPIEQQIGLSTTNIPRKEESCSQRADPGIFMPNCIIGAAMTGEAYVLADNPRLCVKSGLQYNAFNPVKIKIG